MVVMLPETRVVQTQTDTFKRNPHTEPHVRTLVALNRSNELLGCKIGAVGVKTYKMITFRTEAKEIQE